MDFFSLFHFKINLNLYVRLSVAIVTAWVIRELETEGKLCEQTKAF